MLEAAKAGVGVLFALVFLVSSMDILSEEFGNLTPEQLAAPVRTVEVNTEKVGSGRGRDAYPEGGARRDFATELAGPQLRACSMLGACSGVPSPSAISQSGPRVHLKGQIADDLSTVVRSEPSPGWPSGWTLTSVYVCREELVLVPTLHLRRHVEATEAQGFQATFLRSHS